MARDEQQLLLIVAGVYLAFLEDDSDEEDNNDNSPVVKRLKQEIHDSSLANTLVADSILRQPGRGFLEAGKFRQPNSLPVANMALFFGSAMTGLQFADQSAVLPLNEL